ncbi:brachyurin-like [Topomyia yanbarensis]|uniref:brachyurin-like n=1 Tax=Topomyia yanbarensis TaxID=2498891 RepID=UPI00273CA2F8|nr:brachyurin-like [Topomyia yanbarensis]
MTQIHSLLVLFLLRMYLVTSLAHLKDETRVVKGKDAQLGQFPYQCLLLIRLNSGKAAVCGGSLLNDEWILTAGHCVQDAESVSVTLGTIDLKNQANADRVTLNSSVFIRHENYEAGSATNDVALVKLPTKITFTETIQPVKLPNGKDSYIRQKVIVSGFGLRKDKGDVSQKLQYAPLVVIQNAECMLVYGLFAIKSNNICARGENGESACHGDSGGPLVLAHDHTLVGVVSFGHVVGCERSLPVVYARVTEFRDWIRNQSGV